MTKIPCFWLFFGFGGQQIQKSALSGGEGHLWPRCNDCGVHRCQANMAYTRQPTPDASLGFQVKVLKPFSVDPSSLGSGLHRLVLTLNYSVHMGRLAAKGLRAT